MNPNLILIAEDDPDVRDMLSVTLEGAGYHTVGAKDGNTLVRQISALAEKVSGMNRGPFAERQTPGFGR